MGTGRFSKQFQDVYRRVTIINVVYLVGKRLVV